MPKKKDHVLFYTKLYAYAKVAVGFRELKNYMNLWAALELSE